MKRLIGLIRLIILIPLLLPVKGFAVTNFSGVIISELQTTGANNATNQEFIEIYNTSDDAIDISEWKVQYSSSTGTSWQNKATLNGILKPKRSILLASNDYLVDIADIGFVSGLKLEAGHIRIVSPDPTDNTKQLVQDLVGWGTAAIADTSPAVAAPAGSSIERKVDVSGNYVDTNDNSSDFSVQNQPTPNSTNSLPDEVQSAPDPMSTAEMPVEPTVPPSQESQPVASEQSVKPSQVSPTTEELINPSNVGIMGVEAPVLEEVPPNVLVEETPQIPASEGTALQPIEITELLPNPAPPLSDSSDEFIDLYNPNDVAVDLTGFKLQTGNTFSYSYNLDGKNIGPNSYISLYASETGLVLSNSGSKARLLDPNGAIISETDSYIDAKDGRSWVFVDNKWQWDSEDRLDTEAITQDNGSNQGLQQVIDEQPLTETLVPEEKPEPANSFVVEITELLPNPAPPLSDSSDEFIELYNPNDFSVDLSNFKLQSGNSFSYSYTFDKRIMPGNSYLTLYSSDTGLILSNAGGKARLLDPNGDIVSITDAYSDAKDGQSWALINGTWQWTIQPTPANVNVLAFPVAATSQKTSRPKSTKKPASKKVSTSKKKAPASKKKTSKKEKKNKKAEAVATNEADANSQGGGPSLHPLVVAVVGAVALGYAIYEYKDDLANKFRQFKINRRLRRKTGQTT